MYYKNNLDILKNKEDRLYELIEKAGLDIEVDDTVISDTAKNGETVVAIKESEKLIYLNSRYNPSREAEKFMEEYNNLADEAVLVMYGLANGAFARDFLAKNQKSNKIIVYEPNINIFLKVLHDVDLSDFLDDARLYIVVAGINDDMFDFLLSYSFSDMNMKTNRYTAIPVYKQTFPDGYREFVRVIKEKMESLCIGINTINLLGERITYTGIQNMRFLRGCRSGCEYEGLFPEEMPVIIVSAGPSLSKNVELLRKAKGKALIVVVDTAIRAVMSRGIMPDMVISVDNHKGVNKFKVEGLEEVFFLADMSASTDVLEAVKPKNLVFYSADSMVWERLFNSQNSKLWQIYAGGSVALDALALVIAWGFKKIILIGQDLAMTGNKQHVDGADTSKKFNEDDKNIVKVKDIYGEDTLTRKDYFSFIRDIEEIGYRFQNEIEIIDATEGGAFKKHTTIMTLQEALDQYCTNVYNVDEIISSVPRLFVDGEEKRIVENIEEMKNNVKNIGKRLAQAAADCNRAALMMERGNLDVKELKKINASMAKLDRQFVEMDEYSIIGKFVASERYQYDSTIYVESEDDMEATLELYRKTETYYRAVSNAMPRLIGIIDDCLKKIKDEEWF